jgi:hypothetical protein
MTVLILWFVRFLIAYWLLRIILLTMKGIAVKRTSTSRRTTEPIRRFDSKGKNISDAEFREMQ